MNGGSHQNALDRIEAALARIEAASHAAGLSHQDLQKRHEALKASAARSLAQLDSLLAGMKE